VIRPEENKKFCTGVGITTLQTYTNPVDDWLRVRAQQQVKVYTCPCRHES